MSEALKLTNESPLSLLRSVLPVFLAVAEYYVRSEDVEAIQARDQIIERTERREAFHADVHTKLLWLDSVVNKFNMLSSRELHLDSSYALHQLLKTLAKRISGVEAPAGEPLERLYQLRSLVLQRQEALQLAEACNDYGSQSLALDDLHKVVSLACPSSASRQKLGRVIDKSCEALEAELKSLQKAVGSDEHTTSTGSYTYTSFADIYPFVEWTAPEDFFQSIDQIHGILANSWQCECEKDHGSAKVSFAVAKDLPRNHGDFLFYFEKEAEPFWKSAGVQLDKSGKKAAKVMFDTPKNPHTPDSLVKDSTDDLPNPQPLTLVESLCTALHHNDSLGCISIIAKERRLWTTSTKISRHPHHHGNGAIRLSDWLRKSKSMPPERERMVLSVLLAYAYLHLSGGSWWPDEMTAPEIWFLPEHDGGRLNIWGPCISSTISAVQQDNQPTWFDRRLNSKRPSLPSFGKLLLEIYTGSRIEWSHPPEGAITIDKAMSLCEGDPTGEEYLCAVQACLKSGGNILDHNGFLNRNADVRKEFVSKILRHIQFVLEVAHREQLSDYHLTGTPETEAASSIPENEFTEQCISISEVSPAEDPVREAPSAFTNMSEMPALCFHDNGIANHLNTSDAVASESWLERLRSQVHTLFDPTTNAGRQAAVKIAVLDTGAKLHKRSLQLQYGNRLRECRTWYGHRSVRKGEILANGGDEDGHGTHSTSIVLDVAPYSEVYVAQVFSGRSKKQTQTSNAEIGRRIANAIHYAVNEWKVDILIMSFGFRAEVPEIANAIKAGLHKREVLFFAAASNFGANDPIAWPARRPDVLCIHAATANGKSYEANPPYLPRSDNFMTLGTSVKGEAPSQSSSTAPQYVCRSGTSTANAIAAGIAALVIDLMRCNKEMYLSHEYPDKKDLRKGRNNYNGRMKLLARHSGMSKVFRSMSTESQGYDYLAPWNLLNHDYRHRTKLIDKILEQLRE